MTPPLLMSAPPDHRAAARLPLRKPAVGIFRGTDGRRRRSDLLVGDFSSSGAFLFPFSQQDMPGLGQRIELRLSVPVPGGTRRMLIRAAGRVVRVAPEGFAVAFERGLTAESAEEGGEEEEEE